MSQLGTGGARGGWGGADFEGREGGDVKRVVEWLTTRTQMTMNKMMIQTMTKTTNHMTKTL